jgi:uncharacterized membrane protein YqiK
VSYFKRLLTRDECAVVVSQDREPEVIGGPGSVRTFYRWRRVIVVSLEPFEIEVVESNVAAKDGMTLMVGGRVDAQVVEPALAATRVVDYRDATRKILQTAIRAVVKERSSVELSEDKTEPEAEVTRILTDSVGDWGVAASAVSLDLRKVAETR